MTIHIEKLELSAIIGILDFERINKQKVLVDATIDYDYSEHQFISYVDIISIIETMIIGNKYQLLEEALQDIHQTVTEHYSQISRFKLKISKPHIIENANVALSLEYLRQEKRETHQKTL